ncbi:MAG: FMN-binding negative transcriptional regulator [Pseudomonadota bacterium]
MNPSPLFRESREDVLHDLMREHPFATIVSAAGGALSADHAPLVLHEGQAGAPSVLRGHLARGNALARDAAAPIEVLIIFQGPQAYITPSWYASKREHGKVVPTWNYVVVHARGQLRFVTDTQWLLAHLHTLTDSHEGARPAPWAVSDAPNTYVAQQLKGLIGFEIDITSLEGTWKLSQNKGAADRAGVEAGLRGEGGPQHAAVSSLVRERGRS